MPIKTYKNFDLKKLLSKLEPEIPGLMILMVPDEEARFYGIMTNDDGRFIVTRQFEGLERDGSFCCESDDAMFCSLEETISKLGGRKLYQGIEASSLSEGERLMKNYESKFGVPAVQKMLDKLSVTERHEIFLGLWKNYDNKTGGHTEENIVNPWCCVGCEKSEIQKEGKSDFSLCGVCEKYSCPKCTRASECKKCKAKEYRWRCTTTVCSNCFKERGFGKDRCVRCEQRENEENERLKYEMKLEKLEKTLRRSSEDKKIKILNKYERWELRDMCSNRGLGRSGTKKDLISSLVEYYNKKTPPPKEEIEEEIEEEI